MELAHCSLPRTAERLYEQWFGELLEGMEKSDHCSLWGKIIRNQEAINSLQGRKRWKHPSREREVISNRMKTVLRGPAERGCGEYQWRRKKQWRWEEGAGSRTQFSGSGAQCLDNQKSRQLFPPNPCSICWSVYCLHGYTVSNVYQTIHLLYSIYKLYLNFLKSTI